MTQKVILGKYEIIEEIGRGGMGVVYKAKDTRIARIVAIKELLINPALASASEEVIGRFLREAQTAGSLSHPNIVTIHDFGEEDGHHYIAMEFIEGKSLKDYLEEGYKFTEKERLDMLVQICEGLQHAHERKVVHRDIKPDNISITSRGDVKITDFGIARLDTNSDNPMMKMTQDGTMLGTLGYISPEQLQDSRSVDNRTDIFSFGAMMYELYTGRLPFDAGNLGATILKIVSEDPTPPTKINPEVDSRVEAIIQKAMQKLPDYRYQQAGEIVADLKKIIDGASGGSSSTPSSGMVPCPCDKKNMILAGAKFCPYCGLNLADQPAATGPATVQQHTPKPQQQAAAPAQASEFKNRLEALVELGANYQSGFAPKGLNQKVNMNINATSVSSAARKTSKADFSALEYFKSKTSGGESAAPTPPNTGGAPSGGAAPVAGGGGEKASLNVSFKYKVGSVGAGKGQFYQPRGLALLQGQIYVADTQNQRVQVFNKMGDWQFLIRSNSEKEFLKSPCSVAVSPQGQVYVVDSGSCRVVVFDQSGRFLRAFGKPGKAKGEFSNPYGIAISSKGEIYVADTENSRVQVLDDKGQVIKIFGRPGSRPGEFKSPYAIALDSKDNLYVLDYGIPRIQVLDRHGISRLDFGKRGVKEGQFSIPRGLCVDKKGRIYVADTLNHRIQIFTAKGEFIESFGSKGRGPQDFWGPESIAVSDEGDIFVLDKGNSRIQVLLAQSF